MTTDLIEILSGLYELAVFDEVGLWTFQVSTPAHRFTTVVGSLPGGALAALTARDQFSVDLARSLFARLRSEGQYPLPRALTVLDGFHCPGFTFDSVGVIGPTAHDDFVAESSLLHDHTLAVFPMYRCEFSGDEAADEVRLVRRISVVTIDWNRLPSPKVKMSYCNPRTKSSSRGRSLGLTTEDVAFREIRNAEGVVGAFLELENFRHERCQIRARLSDFEVGFGDEAAGGSFSPAQVQGLVREFFHGRSVHRSA